jgi:hypothetical protein
MPPRGFFIFGHKRRRRSKAGDEEVQPMSEPLWKQVGEVVIDLVEVAVVVVATVLIERLLKTAAHWSSSNDSESNGST